MRNKGKVHPSSSSPVTGDTLAVLNLLPAAILTLAVVLSVEDREVLAYMLTHSIKSTNPNNNNNNNNNSSKQGCKAHTHKKAPVFECDCFDCYTSYWFKWDTSPNRELIHQAIEAFEEKLNNSEQCSSNNNNNNNNKKRAKKKEKVTHRKFAGKCSELPVKYDVALVVTQPEGEVLSDVAVELPETTVVTAAKTTETVTVREQNRVGRKVVPDVIGILNWRLWSIWSPNV